MARSPLILGIDTSGPHCGVTVLCGLDVLASVHEEMAKGQAEHLMPLIEETLSAAGADVRDLSAIGVGVGPGNFTGVRISVSAARGLALALGIPAVGVSLLEALALAYAGPILASLDARRDHLYLQRFAGDAPRGPELVPFDAVGEWAHPGLTCIGHRGDEVAGRLGALHLPAKYTPAAAVARIAAARWQDNPPRPAPLYLRPADAKPSRDRGPVMLP